MAGRGMRKPHNPDGTRGAPVARRRARRVREAARGNPSVETPAGRPGPASRAPMRRVGPGQGVDDQPDRLPRTACAEIRANGHSGPGGPSPNTGAAHRSGGRGASPPATPSRTTATHPARNAPPACPGPSAPEDIPSRPRPTHTTATAAHSRPLSVAPMKRVAAIAVTTRLAGRRPARRTPATPATPATLAARGPSGRSPTRRCSARGGNATARPGAAAAGESRLSVRCRSAMATIACRFGPGGLRFRATKPARP